MTQRKGMKKCGLVLLLTGLAMLALMMTAHGLKASAAENDEFEYDLNSDGEAAISLYNGFSDHVTIPAVIDEHPVTSVKAGTFGGYYNIHSVFVPDSVELIARNAFAECAEDITLYGSQDSYAAQFAASKNIPFVSVEQGGYAFLKFNYESLELRVGKSAKLKATLFPLYGNEDEIALSCTDNNTAAYKNGTVTALRPGTAVVTAGYGELKAECSVYSYIPAESIAASDNITLGAGDNIIVGCTAAPADADMSRIKMSAAPADIAKINGNRLYALKNGKAQVRIWYDGRAMKVINVTVKKEPARISFTQASYSTGIGERIPLYSYINDGSAAVGRSYSTSNSSVAEIVRNGWNVTLLTKKAGTANITVKTYNGKTAVCKVSVKPLATGISFDKTQITIGAGESYKLNSAAAAGSEAFNKIYYSWDKRIALIDNNGVVKGVKPGKTTVAVKTPNGKKGWCTVTVMAAPKKITLGRNKLSLVAGESYTLFSKTNDNSASLVRYFTSSASDIVGIDTTSRDGKIKALKPGTAKIRVQTYNGKSDICTVTVLKSSERKRIVDQALSWYHYNEIDGSYKIIFDVYNKGRIPGSYYMRGLDPWCATYVSAVFMKAGMVDLIYPSCSCPTMVRGAMAKGIWKEDDAYVPERGDLIFYNWDDDGVGDCKTGAYHVGIITNVNGGIMTVIEGNHDDNDKNGDDFVEYRKVKINEQFIRGFITPKYKN